jgi:hypothetical protein
MENISVQIQDVLKRLIYQRIIKKENVNVMLVIQYFMIERNIGHVVNKKHMIGMIS